MGSGVHPQPSVKRVMGVLSKQIKQLGQEVDQFSYQNVLLISDLSHVCYPIHLIPFDLIMLIMLGEE